MSIPIYSPMQKSKPGESIALIKLASTLHGNVIPFFDALALKPGTENGQDVEVHFSKQAINIAAAGNAIGTCYVDLLDVDPNARGIGGVHPVKSIFEKLEFERITLIPVVGLERDVAYKLAIRNIIAKGVNALAIRLLADDLSLPSSLFEKVKRLISEVGAHDLPIHVFMDFRSIEHISSDLVQLLVQRALPEIRKLTPGRIVFCASSMLTDMSKVKKNVLKAVPRRDLMIWENLYQNNPDLDYGDYGIVQPGYADFDKNIKPAAKIRYTGNNEWIIAKGTRWISDTSQHKDLAKLIVKSDQFRGLDCWGGESITIASNGGQSPRILQRWVSIDQNNHITHTIHQLARIGQTTPQFA